MEVYRKPWRLGTSYTHRDMPVSIILCQFLLCSVYDKYDDNKFILKFQFNLIIGKRANHAK